MKRILLLTTLFFFAITCLIAQRTVSGKVTDDSGEGLPGVNVVIKGTTNGVTTDLDGSYRMTVDDGATITFSYVGFENQEIEVGARTIIDVTMSGITELQEVVVTGVAIGTSTKKLGFSVGKVNEEQLQKVPATDPGNALRGKTAGVTIVQPSGNPTSAPSIRLRGSTNISGSQSPLIIVDGVITDGSLSDINMNDVQSIEVVKGAAASSLYGSLAGNGVVQIITKRGRGTIDPEVTVRAEYGFSKIARDYPIAERHFFRLEENGDFILNSGGQLTEDVADPDGLMDNLYPADLNFDNVKALLTAQPWRNLSTSVGGGSENINYYLSYQNLNQKGILDGAPDFDRNSLKLNLDFSPIEKVDVKSTINYIKSTGPTVTEQGQGSSNLFFAALTFPQYIDLTEKDANGNYIAAPERSTWFDGNFSYGPLYFLQNADFGLERDRIIGGVDVSYRPLDWLTINGSITIDNSNERSKTFIPKGFETREPGSLNFGRITLGTERIGTQITSGSIIAQRNFGDFNTALTLKYLYEDRTYTYEQMNSSEFLANGVNTIQNAPQSNFGVFNTSQPQTAENYFINLDVDFQDKIIASGLVRRDASSLFGADARSKWYYRGSLAYRLTEDFDVPGVQELKLRASYGTSGQRPSVWSSQYETFSVSQAGIVGRNFGNADLQPSTVKEMELGINVSFLNRFFFEFNYSDSQVEDDILQVPLSATSGFAFQYQNVANLDATAWEFMLSGDVMEKGDFKWDANLNFSTNKTIISSLNGVAPFTRNTNTAIPVFRVQEGLPYGTIYGREIVTSIDQLNTDENGIVLNDPYYIATGSGATIDQYMTNEDGYVVRKAFYNTSDENVMFVMDESDKFVDRQIGNTNPDFIMGLGNTFTYRGISLYVLLDYQKGADIYNYTKQLLYFNYRHQDQVEYAYVGKHRNYSGPSSNIYYGQGATSHFVEDGTFMKVREVSLSYLLNADKLGSIGNVIKSARISLSGRNLFTFTNYSGWDPEVGLGDNPTNFRMDEYSYPNFRTYTASLQLKF
ncbi:SusC/RagA family TonB-linked outer membrane protein [Ekhidna sp. To15]|uniref:SusC/RagA family TonB-linked outer membrane protein n=1 Tax=Ekhidna sp. To15 TaxID=3395267 RepID=UPI003F51EA92